ncbi:hypothetical protein [Nitrosopumilus adriaticus]|uniref:Protein-disulfide isomerase n=1 Tax=Nitrosopumilus adriaticus TaxID=1580092 RepID=A0A0D5C3E4_9ARCH|nr:hypothetical protein [Nitrosopumilus adriaticus]AJW70917.1 hypothetical protein NADRNF5_1229 [Nitrosopumilus adriaticus]
MTADKILPKDIDSDYSLPGRLEESNLDIFVSEEIPAKSNAKIFFSIMLIFITVSSGFYLFYFANQTDIDSQIIENTLNLTPEQILVNQYNVGTYGSEHAHAAIAVIVDDTKLNFGLPQFQLSSKYIHFENDNPYLIHKHATNVPLAMLFSSFGMELTSDCIILKNNESSKNKKFCAKENHSLFFYVNGVEYTSDIREYVFQHNDRILISLGDEGLISKHLKHLESLEIFDIPKKTPENSEKAITI